MLKFNSRKAVSAFILVLYVFVGVPLWFYLTSIYRAKLPEKYIESLYEDKYRDVHMVIPVFIRSETYRFPDIHDAVQTQVNYLLNSFDQPIRWSLQVLPYDDELIESAKLKNSTYHIVNLVLDSAVSLYVSNESDETVVFFDDESVVNNDLPFYVAQTIVEFTYELEKQYLATKDLVPKNNYSIPYNPNIHLSLTLLSGDGAPIAWEIDSSLKKYFSPIRKFLAPYTNFTVDTSIVYFNDLNLSALENKTNITENDLSSVLDLSELSSLNEYSETSALNLAIVFPGKLSSDKGLQYINPSVPNNSSVANWESFIIPRWGALIVNKFPLEENTLITEGYLSEVLYTLSQELFVLIGLTNNTNVGNVTTPQITLNSFKRLLTLKNMGIAVDTLHALVMLVKNFPQISVPKDVLNDVIAALELRIEIADLLNNPMVGDDVAWSNALSMSNKLVELSEAAFFHGEMVQQNYFPQEHKIAVYLPLLGPLSLISLFGFIKVMRDKDSASEKAETKAEDKDETTSTICDSSDEKSTLDGDNSGDELSKEI
ncbi:hypothetical protein Kpol_1023p88 [Vanderwaltozyma polyspora DSM 70294]|uniref:GPI transamidase component GPI17 n=1 Tax=Vanderwaltozyma polyspora (strain ATCC 22028 / DSM 70294 / BCRC 21397 / CBS 2163 / NBRC 10782 / NRRL Y-8283 / UCD 57-17) TaxID=436907 RepID=A7TFV9_VANPO|nr:uncharacterized protein Kpol_1023p88 [Vanderwaltozyma polyspora DSM 70294]EDO18917.1 hypothetical protein Kpol_1023p88 [Vanderwaltozyma polyspora DSM 70294]